jgi:hypothetical protein
MPVHHYSIKLMNRCANELRHFLTILVRSVEEEAIGDDNRSSKCIRFGVIHKGRSVRNRIFLTLTRARRF